MPGTAAGAVKAAKTKALGAGLRLRKGKTRKKGTTRKTTTASFGRFKAVKDKKAGKKRKHKKSTLPDPMLFECDDETTRKIEAFAHEYKAAARDYSKAGDDVKRLKVSLIDAVKGSNAKPSAKDGSYRIRAGDSVVSVTPSDEKVKVELDEDEKDA